jgi:hypothetical protein
VDVPVIQQAKNSNGRGVLESCQKTGRRGARALTGTLPSEAGQIVLGHLRWM